MAHAKTDGHASGKDVSEGPIERTVAIEQCCGMQGVTPTRLPRFRWCVPCLLDLRCLYSKGSVTHSPSGYLCFREWKTRLGS